jgi:ubiquinone/menaquinone biosynthesis C-methylase UbiE
VNLSLGCCGIGTNIFEGPVEARLPQNEVGPVYDKLAGIYDVWGTLTESRARKRAIELADIRDGRNVLEVAVGTGLAFYEIVKRNRNGNNIGIDLSQGMLDKAKKRLSRLSEANYKLLTGTAFALPVKNESIDVLMNNYMFDLISYEDMDKVLDEFRRVLKQNGRLVLVNMTEGESPRSRLYDAIYRVYPKAMGGCRGVKLAERLKQRGFRVELREYYQQMCFPSEVILAYKEKTV